MTDLIIQTSKNRPGKGLIWPMGGNAAVMGEVVKAGSYAFMRNGYEFYVPHKGTDGILGVKHPDGFSEPPSLSEVSRFSEQKRQEILDRIEVFDGSSKTNINKDNVGQIIEEFKKWDIRYILPIGGNSTAAISMLLLEAAKQMNYEIKLEQILKTIDNDTTRGDHCLGYPSALRHEALRAIKLEIDNIYSGGIYVVITMGRDAGWLAIAYGLLARKIDIYTTRFNYNIDHIAYNAKNQLVEKNSALIVISEGAQYHWDDSNGEKGRKLVSQSYCEERGIKFRKEKNLGTIDPADNVKYLSEAIETGLTERVPEGTRIRIMPPDYTMRSEIDVSQIDKVEGKFLADEAVYYLLSDCYESGAVGSIREGNRSIYSVHSAQFLLADIAGQTREIPSCFVNPDGGIISNVAREWMGPLAGTGLPFSYDYLLDPSFGMDNFCKPHPGRKT